MKLPQPPPAQVLVDLAPDRLFKVITEASPLDPKGRYLHWDQMRRRPPPAGLTRHEWWVGTRSARSLLARPLPLPPIEGDPPFTFSNVDVVHELVHHIDQRASGQILADDVVTNLRGSDRYLVSSLAEEAITSSQLEGASTERRVAKEMLLTGRQPRDRSEQMILNNFRAMQVAQELARSALTPEAVLDLHRQVAADTLDDPDDAGRLQRPEDVRVAVYWHDDTVLHRPPPAEELPDRLEAMCRFANGETPGGFLHPVVRAILLHFWLAYDHPFADGNGRTARTLFYWSMLRERYWLTQYLSVSSILRRAPAQYVMPFLYVESDRNDTTYFVIHQLHVIERAIDSLHEYLARKVAENRDIEAMLHGSAHLNQRQLLVVRDALRDPTEIFTIAAQARRNQVSHEASRQDLRDLERRGLLVRARRGKMFVYRAVPDVPARLGSLAQA